MSTEPRTVRAGLIVAVAAEIVYIAGRTLIPPMSDPVFAELAKTAWRLPFLLLYAWLVIKAMPPSVPRLASLRSPVIMVIVALVMVIAPILGWGVNADWTTRLVYMAVTPLVALREELFYRVILQRSLEGKVHPFLAVLITTILFVPYHFGTANINLFWLLSLFTGGLILGIIYQRTESLAAVVILHTITDVCFLFPPIRLLGPFAMLAIYIASIVAAISWWFMDLRRSAKPTQVRSV